MTNDDTDTLRERLRQQDTGAADLLLRSARAWSELLATSTDMAFDAVLKNWDYSRSLRGAADQAVADTLRTRQRLTREMLQAWQGCSDELREMIERGGPH
jgi:hypothetical protein